MLIYIEKMVTSTGQFTNSIPHYKHSLIVVATTSHYIKNQTHS